MTNQPNRDLTQQAQDLDDQQLEAVAGGFNTDFEKEIGDIGKGPTVTLPAGGQQVFR